MTAPVVTVDPQELVADAARRLHAWGLDQLPVVDRAGVLIGIISRADVLKVFLRSDAEIRLELLDDIAGRLLRLPADRLEVEVDGGVVTLAGHLERRSRVVALIELAGLVDGVVAVGDRLTFEHDDLANTKAPPAASPRYRRPRWVRRTEQRRILAEWFAAGEIDQDEYRPSATL
jgi:CBS domain/BON domain